MRLYDVENPEQLTQYYLQENLQTIEDKIDHLKRAMKVRAMRGGGNGTPDAILTILEESCLLGYWKASW